ncbi:MAG TPA: Gfo/Idh/MocA family oxidoreductase [Chloroflexota bacterium]|nr:Gfo/Idh/MocA family oxidoreductase [Chloroflexota bacterium]HZU04531.1 Gfo/Idh/MocA family oxidoreductase [Chloroflexota bacterium]
MIRTTRVVAPTVTGELSRPTRVGVAGYGYWGPKVVRNFAALPHAELVAVCDLVPERLVKVQEQYPGVQVTTDFAELLASDVEAVAIATPVATHFTLARQALLAGKHVFMEKPLTASTQEAAELVALAKARGCVLMVDHPFLFEPAVECLREVVQSGELGEIWHITSQRLNLGLFRRDANVLWDLAPHDVAILLAVLGTAPTAVSARGASHVQPGIHDVVYLNLQFPQGTMAHVHVSWLEPQKVRRMTIVGSRKMAVYDDLAPEKLCVYDRRVCYAREGDPTAELLYHLGATTAIPLPAVEPLYHLCAHFVDCVRGEAQPRADGWQGLQVVHILEQADRSLHNGGSSERLDGAALNPVAHVPWSDGTAWPRPAVALAR